MAYYYPIKCPYCLKSHTNSTVRFNLNDAIIISKKAVWKNVSSDNTVDKGADSFFSGNDQGWYAEPSVNEFFLEGGSDWDTDVPDTPSSFSTNRSSIGLPSSGYFTLDELKAIFGEENIKAEEKIVITMPALTSEAYSGNLLVGVTIRVIEDGNEIEKMIRGRYCDCGDNRKMSESSGSIPSYVILLMGSSDSGKTVYLASLYHSLSRKGKYSFPPTTDPCKAIADLWLSVLSEGKAETDIETITEDLYDYGILPFSTLSMTNEPLTMEVTVMFNRTGHINKALLFLRDVPGEYFTNRDKQQELRKIMNQFPKFDGFMITFDPMTFKETVFPAQDSEEDRKRRKQVSQFRQVIIKNIAPTMANNMINQPVAAIVTKGDMFFDRIYTGALKNKGISYAMPLLAKSQQESFDKPYFDEINYGAYRIIERLSEDISELMSAHFNNAFFTMVSALSRNPIDMYIGEDGRRRVSTPSAINPWHVTDPMLRLLMKLHIIPPLDETRARAMAGENQYEREARKSINRNIINEWGAKYCAGGYSGNLV